MALMMEIRDINILYTHGMGGGGDSRIPSILNDYFKDKLFVKCDEQTRFRVNVIVRTYDFNPKIAHNDINKWVQELSPSLIIGESLGSIHAIRIKGLPHILVSPSLGAPLWLGYSAPLMKIPGITKILDRVFVGKGGDRQKMVFTYDYLKEYVNHSKSAFLNMPKNGSQDYFYAFFGTKDHYRKYGVVSVRMYKKYFGSNYSIYKGTHFMEEEYLHSLLIPKILEVLNLKLCDKIN